MHDSDKGRPGEETPGFIEKEMERGMYEYYSAGVFGVQAHTICTSSVAYV